ncbi:MAG TPA: YceI family protein [Pseudogracilibacillus sp.]|nr:YceI family protein [Pseudogracilibacillus sp.]
MATWHVDPSHTEVGFTVKHLQFSQVSGRFTDVSGKVVGDPEDLTSAKATLEINAASVHTGSEDRDKHLLGDDFFAVDQYPTITFTSKKVTKNGDDRYTMTGDIVIRGITKEIDLDVEFRGRAINPFDKDVAAYDIRGSISRKDFGIMWNMPLPAGGFLLDDEVKLHITTQTAREQDES